jgi:exopolysaccharide biosynthesis polyprenyl glycosylphosphotransferase
LVLGVLFTDLGPGDSGDILDSLFNRVTKSLSSGLSADDGTHLRLAFQMFPENNVACGQYGTSDLLSYADHLSETDPRRVSRVIKTVLDIAVSCLALIVISPLLCAIALAIKLTSPGPVLFRQNRIGRNGVRFTFLKFRSMYASSDETIHKQYVEDFMSGKATGQRVIFKLRNDPRVTRLGRMLRTTSLDELPQLFNVLQGEMSLVGPRPPLPYEFERYELWHRRRLLNVKPGITGLWQVGGRSRVTFDEMVRLDLNYLDTWSLLLDVKILLRTPAAVLSGEGAY